MNGAIEIVDRQFDFVRVVLPYDYAFTCNAQQWDEAERICRALEGPMISQGITDHAQQPTKPWVCCHCDADLSCAACGVEQPNDSAYYENVLKENETLKAAKTERKRDPKVVAAVQQAIMKHPFWTGNSAFAFGLANTAIDALTIASSVPSTHQSAPVRSGSLPSGESDPSVTLDYAGADTSTEGE